MGRARARGHPDRGHADRRAEHDLRVLGEPVVGGDRAVEVVRGGDRQRLAGLDGMGDFGRRRRGERERGEQGLQDGGARVTSVVVGGVCSFSRVPCREPAARRYDALHAALPPRGALTCPCTPACAASAVASRPAWMPPTSSSGRRSGATTSATRCRGTARGSTPSSRAGARSAAGRCTATCSRCCARAGSSSASTCCSSRASG